MPPRLILHADDFGLTPGINRAVVELHRAGVLTSASLMATGPAFDDAVALSRQHPSLGVGCHLVFVDGMPVSHAESIPSLLGADGKTFRPSLLDFAQAALRGTIRANDLAREAQAQIQKLQRAGIEVTHIDTHKHTHVLPGVAAPILHVAECCGVLPVRNPFEPRWSSACARVPFARRLQLRAVERLQPAFERLTSGRRALGFVPAGTLGIAATGTLDAPTLRRTFDAMMEQPGDPVYELCCHPGYVDAALAQQRTRLRASREVESRALLEVVPQIFSDRRLCDPQAPALIHYGALGVPGLKRDLGQWALPSGYEKVL